MVAFATPRTRPSKRLCVFSDGSWKDPESKVPTNILRLAKSIKQTSADSVPQLVFYDPGVGTAGSIFDKASGGAFGTGIDLNIMELYTFLALNYTPGDEIYLFGYSRGAYTVRSLAGFIHEAGLVVRSHLDFVKEAYDLYRSPIDPESPEAKKFRATHGARVPIKLISCFDTVGALGLPFELSWPLSTVFDKYRFHNTTLSPMVENGIHALSIDEKRKSFLPTRMTPCNERGPKQVTELFLPGRHGGVDGGGTEKPFADNALRFVVDEMLKRRLGLALDMDRIPDGGPVLSDPEDNPEGLKSRSIRLITGTGVRNVESIDQLHKSAVVRYRKVPKWRPAALKSLDNVILGRMIQKS